MNSKTDSPSGLQAISSFSPEGGSNVPPAAGISAAIHIPPQGQIAASFTQALAHGENVAFLPEGCNIHLFPDGEFAASDGRPGSLQGVSAVCWRMDATIAAPIIADVENRKTPLVVDYEHQTLAAAENGKPAPAAGWITHLVHVPGQGLFAKAAWTETAQKHITTGEYRYISPVFHFDRVSGAVTRLLHAALTNFPALDGLAAVAARHESDCPASGIPPQTAGTGNAEAAASETQAALTAVAALQRENATLAERLAASEQRVKDAALAASLEAALADGRLPVTLAAWARDLASTNPAALTAYLNGAKPLAALTGMQTQRASRPVSALSADDIYVADKLGISREAFALFRAEHQ